MTIPADVPLAPYTTLGVGGPARWLIEARSDDELLDGVRFAHSINAPVFILGGGSNLLVSDGGFPGVVIRQTSRSIDLHRQDGFAGIHASAGVDWDSVVNLAIENSASGIECLAGIPGSVGGTPVQNVGAYGQEVADSIIRVTAIDIESERMVQFSRSECGFAYRNSIFNTTHRGRYAITRVEYLLRLDQPPHLQYRDLKQRFAEKPAPTLAQAAAAVRAIRAGKGMLLSPGDPDSRSAGSFFKNPVVPTETIAKLAIIKGCNPDEVPQFPVGAFAPPGHTKLSAAWLIELAGFGKGFVMGNAGLSAKHVLAIVNRGGATASEIVALRDCIVDAVRTRTGIHLEQEPVMLGFGQ